MLTHLDVRGMRGIKAIDLTSQPYFEQLKATGSEVASVSFAKGAPVNRLELPATMKTLTLEQLPYLSSANLVFENIVGIHTINIKRCPNLTNSFAWVKNWYDSKASVDARCTLIMDNVNWEGINADDLLNVAKVGTLDLKGKVVLTEITAEQIASLTEVFGEGAFNKDAEFYIDAPAAVFVTGRTTIVEGESEQYKVVVVGAELQRAAWSIKSGNNSYVTFDANTASLSVAEGYGNGTIVLSTNIITDKGTQTVETSVTVKAIVYPTSSNTSIKGNSPLETEYETFSLSYPDTVTGQVVTAWSLSGLEGYAVIDSQDASSCVIKKLQEAALLVTGTLTCVVTKKSGASLFTLTKTIEVVNDTIAETDAGICKALFDAGLCANETYITKDEAALIVATDLQPGTSASTSVFYGQRTNIKSFTGFKYFLNVTSLGRYCFYNCTSLTSIELPSGITSLGDSCFYGCWALTSIELPSGITSLGSDCFGGCRALTSIELPSGITSLSNYCFEGCTSLTSIELPSGITSLGQYCFSDCRALISIELPSGITSLGSSCFKGCSSLTSIELPSVMTSLGASCFKGCSSLTSIELPSGITSLGNFSFEGCTSLTSIELPSGMTSLGESCFSGCSALTSIELPSGITSFGKYCFTNCSALTSIKLPSGITSLGASCFKGCSSLTSIELPSVMTSLGASCFSGCSALTSIELPSGMKSFGDSCFYDCRALTSIELPSVMTSLGESCFENCSSLTSIELPSGITSLGKSCFSGCSVLKIITSLALTAPIVYSRTFGTSSSTYTGRNTYSTGENMLYVPAGATGYDTSYWLDPLCNAEKCGFTLSATL